MSTVVIVGANRGIGLELCKQYLDRQDTVYALCRSASPELQALNANVIEGIDVTDETIMDIVAEKFTNKKVDILIHNSGILKADNWDDLSFENMRDHFEVNTLGPLRIVRAFAPYMNQPSKIGLVSSRVGSINDNSSGRMYAYRTSKTALNMVAKNIAIDLKGRDIAVAILHPGYVKTRMTGYNGDVEPSESAAGLITRMDELNLSNTGHFWHAQGQELPF